MPPDYSCEELGPWAADYFILESITVLESRQDLGTDMFAGGRNGERASLLLRILNQGPLARLRENRCLRDNFPISSKVKRLISFLCNQDPRAELWTLVCSITGNSQCLMSSTFILPADKWMLPVYHGCWDVKQCSQKNTMAELLDLKSQSETLVEFRARRKNLIIATDTLEEGH